MKARYTPVETLGRVELASIPSAMAAPISLKTKCLSVFPRKMRGSTYVPIWKITQKTEKERPLSFSMG